LGKIAKGRKRLKKLQKSGTFFSEMREGPPRTKPKRSRVIQRKRRLWVEPRISQGAAGELKEGAW